MAYFPFFVDLEGARGLIAGGGAVAARKARNLLPFCPQLRVVAPEMAPELLEIPGISLLQRRFQEDDLEGCSFVIAATDCRALNQRIGNLCREQGIPVNVADCREECTFLFPALIQRGMCTVGVCTGGESPAAAAWLRRRIEKAIPEHLEEILAYLQEVRPAVKAQAAEEARGELFAKLFLLCLERGRPLRQEELTQAIETHRKEREGDR